MGIDKELVRELLQNARENDFTFDGVTDKEVALDMIAYSEYFEEEDEDELAAIIGQVRNEPT